mmetsp:Transcript_6686/g.17241  ORF Transcript_6686/g.17241 Transcript_6686/m.17241 type:complete len:217 (+) Transcript_6686:658-1308(+)
MMCFGMMLCSNSCSLRLARFSFCSCSTILWMSFISQKIAMLPSAGSLNLLKDTANHVPSSSSSSNPCPRPWPMPPTIIRSLPGDVSVLASSSSSSSSWSSLAMEVGFRSFLRMNMRLLQTEFRFSMTSSMLSYRALRSPKSARRRSSGLPSRPKSLYMVFSEATIPKSVHESGFCCSMIPLAVKMVKAVSVYRNTACDRVTVSITSRSYFCSASCS